MTLVFVSAVNDATIRAVNYAVSLGAPETRAVTFELDPEGRWGSSATGSIAGSRSRSTSWRRRSAT
ncbi:MAG: hypothetical protein U0V56_06190 [Actinomycetota bacterium]